MLVCGWGGVACVSPFLVACHFAAFKAVQGGSSPLGVRRKGGFYILNLMLPSNSYNYPTKFLITSTELGETLHNQWFVGIWD